MKNFLIQIRRLLLKPLLAPILALGSLFIIFLVFQNCGHSQNYKNASLTNTNSGTDVSTVTPTPFEIVYPTPVPPQPAVYQRKRSTTDVASSAFQTQNSATVFKKEFIHQPTLPEALCNDGTEAIYFIKKGFGAGSKRWVIWTEGGAACGTADGSCSSRIADGLTGSAHLNSITTVPNFAGILDKTATYNPDFNTYNLVSVHYCSSDLWRGTGTKRVWNTATGEKWWFSGQKIIEALLLDLKQKYSFDQAENIILTGSSAGGAGITMNTNLIKSKYPTKDIVTIIDAVWLMNYPLYFNASTPVANRPTDRVNFSAVYDFTGMNAAPACEAAFPTTKHLCGIPSIGARFLNVPFFVTSDQLDNALLGIYGLDRCVDRNPAEYSEWLNPYLIEFKRTLDERATGYFAPRTGIHGLDVTGPWSSLSKGGISNNGTIIRMRESFAAWYFGDRPTIPVKMWAAPVAGKFPHQESDIWMTDSGCH